MGVLRRVCEDTPRPIRETNPEVPDWLQAIIEKLQAKDPAGRFESAAEVAGLFGRCLAHLERPGKQPPFRPDRPASPRPARTRAVAVAALLLASAVGLGASEASGITGLTDLVATVLRVKTAQGTLVLQVDDPEIKVRIDGEDVVLTEPGRQEIRLSLRAGEHRVEKAKGGVSREELITITRGGKQTLKVAFEPDTLPQLPTAPARADLPGPQRARGDARPVEPSAESLRERIKDLEGENRRIERDRHRLMLEAMRLWRERSAGATPGEAASARPPAGLPGPTGTSSGLTALPGPSGLPVAVYSVAASPDGKILAAGCSDGAIRLFDRATGVMRGTLAGHRAEVRAVAYSPDGRTLASAGGDYRNHEEAGELKLWDLAEGRVRHELVGHTALVWSVAFSPDGRTLASGAWDNTARLWDAGSGRLRAVLEGHRDAVRFVTFSRLPEGDDRRGGSPLPGPMLATAGFDGEIRFWHHAPGGEEDGKLWKVHALPDLSGLSCIAFSPDDRTLALGARPSAGERANEIILLDLATWAERGRLRGHPHRVLSLAFSPDGGRLASGGGLYDPTGGSGEVILWDVAGLRPLAHSDRLRYWVESVAFTPDGSTLVGGGGIDVVGGEVRSWALWDMSGAKDQSPGMRKR